MADPILRGGTWWTRREDGGWVRWDAQTGRWEPRDDEPPPPTPAETRASRPYSPARGWATATIVLLALGVVLDVIAMVSDVTEYALLQKAESTGITLEEADENDARQALIGGAQALMLLGTGIVFIIWFHRCYRNLIALGAWDLRFGTGWAIGGWFVPVLSWWRPKQIANDIWRASDPGERIPVILSPSERVPPVLTLWWVAWLASLWLGEVLARNYFDASPSLSQLQNLSLITLVADALSALAGVLAISVVHLLTTRQEQREGQLRRTPAVG